MEEKNMKKTTKELQKVAKDNGFYLCPEKLWNQVANLIQYKDSEIKRLKASRDAWKKKVDILSKELKSVLNEA